MSATCNIDIGTMLTTKGGRNIPRWNIVADNILGKSIFLYAGSNSGKSTIMKNIIAVIAKRIEMIYVVSPNDKNAKDGYADIGVPRPFIRVDVGAPKMIEKYMEDRWQRQEYVTEQIKIANSMESIEELYDLVKTSATERVIANIDKAFADNLETISHLRTTDSVKYSAEYNKFEDRITTAKKKIYRDCVLEARDYLLQTPAKLTEVQIDHLEYIDTNAKVMLVMDDCAKDTKPIQKAATFSKFTTRGRHVDMTFMMAIHATSNMEKDARMNARVSIFGNEESAFNFFSNSDVVVDDLKEIIDEVFGDKNDPVKKFNRLVYEAQVEPKFFYVRADPVNGKLEFGSPKFREFCDAVVRPIGMPVATNNQFARYK